MTIRPPAHSYPPRLPATPGTFARAGLFFLLVVVLSACGQKGDLYLPDPKAPKVPAPDPLSQS
ncbi:putative small periplasmic lipoprotein [Thiorhodovibrio winogradskyi]|uniref:Small periplasmic lipoprotein n=1 Tax=Thiorhodovibrio winogradskyi TaxID=77007 RepID=A0ABZ0SAF4_9GAMM|nr:lipoprotein [Thiorhodovibrio winogradskyi]